MSTNISNNSRISVLVLDRPLLSNPQEDNCDHISQTLAHHQSLEALSLKYSRITDFGVFLLSQELMTNNYLRCLNLEWYLSISFLQITIISDLFNQKVN